MKNRKLSKLKKRSNEEKGNEMKEKERAGRGGKRRDGLGLVICSTVDFRSGKLYIIRVHLLYCKIISTLSGLNALSPIVLKNEICPYIVWLKRTMASD